MTVLTRRRPRDFRTVRSISGYPARVAAALLAIAVVAAPASAETPRERCRGLLAGAARGDAVAACDEVLQLGGGAEDMWAAAEARLARPAPPTMDDLYRAHLLAEAAVTLAPREPWGYLTRLAIARRWGDPELVARRRLELEGAAGAHPAAQRAVAEARPGGTPARLLLGWGALLACGALTLVHALRRRLAARAPLRPVAVVFACAVGAASLAVERGAARAEAFPIDDADPERQVPTQAEANARPMDFAYYLQEVASRAEQAGQRGDHATALRYYRALALAVPDASAPQQKICASALALGERGAAIVACRAALGLQGVRAEDFMRFGDLVLEQPAPEPALLDDVVAAARHLAAQDETRIAGWQLMCRVGVRSASVPLLEECTAGLVAAGASDSSTHVYRWSLAMHKGELDDARRFAERARAEGAGAAAVARMEAAMAARGQRSGPTALALLGASAALLGAFAFALGPARRRRRVSAP